MSTKNIFVVRDLSSFDLWRRRLRRLEWSWNLPYVHFQLEDLSLEENERFTALAARFQKACGCGSGSFLMSAAAVSMIVLFFVAGNGIPDISIRGALTFVGVAVLAALFGKLLGLLWARWRLLRLASTVRETFAREKAEPGITAVQQEVSYGTRLQ